ncbi:Conserved Sel1-like TRP-containg protein of unknown function [Magnetospira sp. QH-2]|nr:Conserved Sel1-like TRP-containg protein of unknown function [Magnetospira sp. QH-2]
MESEPISGGISAYYRSDFSKALTILRPLAEQGNPIAQYRLGVMYDRGEGVPENDQIAFKWFERAAVQGHRDALFNTGLWLLNGIGVESDPPRAILMLREVNRFRNGDFEAQLYADLWERYQELFQRMKPALGFVLGKAKEGDVWAQTTYAEVHRRWRVDRDTARHWSRMAANNGSMKDKFYTIVDDVLFQGRPATEDDLAPHVEQFNEADYAPFFIWLASGRVEKGERHQVVDMLDVILQTSYSEGNQTAFERDLLVAKAIRWLLTAWEAAENGQFIGDEVRLLKGTMAEMTRWDLEHGSGEGRPSLENTGLAPHLAHLYLYGVGVPQDVVEAHKFNLISEGRKPNWNADIPNFLSIDFDRQEKDLAQFASPEVLREARIRAAQWWLETLRKP